MKCDPTLSAITEPVRAADAIGATEFVNITRFMTTFFPGVWWRRFREPLIFLVQVYSGAGTRSRRTEVFSVVSKAILINHRRLGRNMVRYLII